MYRKAMEQLISWKKKDGRKPLIIRGARQVGKTWLMREFGKTECGGNYVYINFDHNEPMRELFAQDLDPKRILTGLELYSGKKILPHETLLIFDEIQEVPNALASLKYFCEDAPEYMILCAGSLLGIALHPGTSFPVGKTEFLSLFPLSFPEFLDAIEMTRYAELIEQREFSILRPFKGKLSEALKLYYYIGGMPEAVAAYVKNRDFREVRDIQGQILAAYDQDFSKHAPTAQVPKIRYVWESLPAQLSKENKKFIYGVIREGARAKEFETAIMWLSDCGLIHKVNRVTAAKLPLMAYEDLKAFKIYMVDVGLLGCASGLESSILLEGNRLFTEFKGALTEQYVLQQLLAESGFQNNIFYYTNDRSIMEIDFLFSRNGKIIPLEVKAEENLKSKSLKAFCEKYSLTTAVRTSMSDYRAEEKIINVPLYAVSEIKAVLDDARA